MGFTKVTGLTLQRSLGRKLVPVADTLRDLYTRFGLRPYAVSIVRTRWSGGKRDVGVETVIGQPFVLLPTPLISDMTTLAEINTAIGLDETGEVLLSQVSGRFTEDQLRGHDDEGNPVGPAEQFYYEVEFPDPHIATANPDNERRRFVIKGAPMYFSDLFQWNIRLEKARQDRSRSGSPR